MNDNTRTRIRSRLAKGAASGTRSLLESAARLGADRELDIEWSETWTADLDGALDRLPSMRGCDHDVFRALCEQTTAKKRFALVRHDGEVVSVVALRRRPGFWEPVTYDVVPFGTAPAREGWLGRVLGGLGVEIRIEGLRTDPTELDPRVTRAYDHYRADLTGPFERHWRSKGRMSSINKSRRENADLELRVDSPGDVAWTVETWVARWVDDEREERIGALDRIRAWELLQGQGQVRSIVLADAGEPVAGNVVVVDGSDVHGFCKARLPGVDRPSLGTRLFDASMNWAAEAGYETYDLGGGPAYKRWWAPVAGQHHWVAFRPAVLDAPQRWGARLKKRVGRAEAQG